MAEYRTLHTKLWQDEWVCELKPDAKLLFIYLVTNRAASVAGIYKLPPKFIAFETGIAPARVADLLTEFQGAGKVYHENGVIWVKNLRAYQTYHGQATRQVQARIDKDLADIPNGALKRAYLAYYATGAEPAVPTAYPPDTHGIPTPETETETETDTDTDTDTDTEKKTHAGVPPAPPEPSEPDPVKELAAVFEQAAGVKLPTPSGEKAKKQVGVLWWQPLREMVRLANGNSEALLRAAVKQLRAKNLNVSSPQSCLKTFISLNGAAVTAGATSKFIDYSPSPRDAAQ